MILDEEPASWLARARLQSQRLADARATHTRPWRPHAQRIAGRRLQRALAGALALVLLASGAFALVAGSKTAPAPPLPSLPPPALRAPTGVVTIPRVKIARRKDNKAPRPLRATPPLKFEDGDGELIIVAPHEPPAPLFSPEEWKRRGSSQP